MYRRSWACGRPLLQHRENYKGQITFFAWEVYTALCERIGTASCSPSAMRRNVIVEGVDLNQLIDKKFEIQGVQFEGAEECSPCYWMDRAVGPGAEEFLGGQGGLRARILTHGWLLQGETTLKILDV